MTSKSTKHVSEGDCVTTKAYPRKFIHDNELNTPTRLLYSISVLRKRGDHVGSVPFLHRCKFIYPMMQSKFYSIVLNGCTVDHLALGLNMFVVYKH